MMLFQHHTTSISLAVTGGLGGAGHAINTFTSCWPTSQKILRRKVTALCQPAKYRFSYLL